MQVTEESHTGWSFKPDMVGGYYIVDQHGWELAHLKYDYAHTCNATNHARARLLSAAPELLSALQAMHRRYGVHSCTEIKMAGDAIAKAIGENN